MNTNQFSITMSRKTVVNMFSKLRKLLHIAINETYQRQEQYSLRRCTGGRERFPGSLWQEHRAVSGWTSGPCCADQHCTSTVQPECRLLQSHYNNNNKNSIYRNEQIWTNELFQVKPTYIWICIKNIIMLKI